MRRAVALVACCLALAPAAAAAVETPYCAPAPAPRIGMEEVARTEVSERVLRLDLRSDAMGRVEPVTVLLPRDYDASGATRYPVLYLLHGAFDDHAAWLEHGAEEIVGDLPLIVVMPDGGTSGSYSDWYGTVAGTAERAPAWESYHVRELIPYVDATFPTVDDRSGRFVTGLSMGGHGAMKYAAANPGLFGAAGEFSGAVHTTLSYPIYPAASQGVWLLTATPWTGPAAHCTWGDPVTHEVVWRDNDPTYLAENLAGIPLFLTTGNGQPGPLDPPGAGFDLVEWTVNEMNKGLSAALAAEEVPHTTDFYGPGTHTWPYWTRALERFLEWLEPKIGRGVPRPERFDVRSARSRFSAWGWRFHAERAVREFVYLSEVSREGLRATGSGRLGVSTPPDYEPGVLYVIRGAGGPPQEVPADDAGRLRFELDLGPSHAVHQQEFGPDATDGWTRRHVRIERAGS